MCKDRLVLIAMHGVAFAGYSNHCAFQGCRTVFAGGTAPKGRPAGGSGGGLPGNFGPKNPSK